MDHRQDGSGSFPTGSPHRFGRGWIPAERDIGLPGDEGFAAPLPPAGGAGEWDEGDPVSSQGRREWGHGRGGAGFSTHTGWTPARKLRFLDHLAEHGNVRAACAAVGLSAEAAYRLRRRDTIFAEAWASALVLARAHAEQVLADFALNGVEEHVWYRGELVGRRRRFDGRLLLAHLGRLDRLADETVAGPRAARFDELLALVSGERFPEDMADMPAMWHEGDPLLPMERDRYVDERSQAAGFSGRRAALGPRMAEAEAAGRAPADWRRFDKPEQFLSPEERDAVAEAGVEAHRAAGDAAGAAWDDWRARARAVTDAIDAGAGEGAEAAWDDAPPIEYKSLHPPADIPPLDTVNSVNPVSPCAPPAGSEAALYKPAPPPHPPAGKHRESAPCRNRRSRSSLASSPCGKSPTASPARWTNISPPKPSGRTTGS